MTTDSNDPDTQDLFRRFLEGRQPRPFDDVQRSLATSPVATSRKSRLPRRAGLVAIAAAVVVVAAIAVVATTGHNGPESLRTATDPDSTIASTTSDPLPADSPTCGPEVIEKPKYTGKPSAAISPSYPASGVTDHFGDRFNSIWAGDSIAADESDPRFMIAATHITDADRAWAASVPLDYGHIQLVDAEYSKAQLEAFAARMRTKIPDWSLPAEYEHHKNSLTLQDIWSSTTVTFPPIPHSVYPKGLYNVRGNLPRLDGTDNAYETIVTVTVINCSTSLIRQTIDIANSVNVPLDAIHIMSIGYP